MQCYFDQKWDRLFIEDDSPYGNRKTNKQLYMLIEIRATQIMEAIGYSSLSSACKERVIIKFTNRKTAITCPRSRAKLKSKGKGKSLGLSDNCKLVILVISETTLEM